MSGQWVQQATMAFVACACLSSGCSPGGESAADAGAVNLQAVEHPGDVLAYDVTWTSPEAIGTELDVACDRLDPWTISDSVATTSHHVFLMGLASGVSCSLKAVVSGGGGGATTTTATTTASTTIDVGVLPGYLPAIDVTVPAKPGTIAPGWTLVDLTDEHAGIPYSAALIDAQGRYRWYFQYPTMQTGSDSPVTQYKGGVVVGGRGLPMSYVTWEGQIVWKGPLGDHEVREAETPGDFYYITEKACSSLTNAGGTVEEYDPTQAKNIWRWNLCDHYTPPEDVYHWAHLNAVSLFPDQKSLLVSSRNQNALFKVDRATGNVRWIMGYAGAVKDGFHGQFTIADSDRFYQQHDTTLLPNGHILMFDNGQAGVREYSRALEIAYTYNASGTSEAHVVWQYRPNPDIFAPIWGSAQRFANGDTLVDFGQRDAGVQSTVVEVSSDSKPLWEIKTPQYWGVYRAERIANPPHGFVIH